MATHQDHCSGKPDSNSEEEDQHRKPKHSGLSPESLSWEDENFPIFTPNTDISKLSKASEENTAEEVQNSPGPSQKQGKIPGYGKFAAFLQDQEENDEDFLDEDALYAPEEEEDNSPGRGQLESSLHSDDAEEDMIPVQNRKVSIPCVETEIPCIFAKQEGEARNLMEEEDAHIATEREMEAEYSTHAHEGGSLISEVRLEAISSNEKQQGTTNVYDERGEARVSVEAQACANMPSIHGPAQEVEIISDKKQVSSCQQDKEAHIFTQQHVSADIATQEQERAHTPKDHKKDMDIPSSAVGNTACPSFEREEVSPKLLEKEEPALTECIQQGESLLHRLHVVQQKQQSPEESEEFSVMTNQPAVFEGNTEALEGGNNLTDPDTNSCGEEKDEDAPSPSQGLEEPQARASVEMQPSHGDEQARASVEMQPNYGDEQARASGEMQPSHGDDQSDSGVSADSSTCGMQEPQAYAAASTSAAQQLPPGTPAQRKRHESWEPAGSLQSSSNLIGGAEEEEAEQISVQKDPLEGQCSSAGGSVTQGGEGQGSAGKRTEQQINSKVNREEDLVRLGKALGECYVRKFKERRMLFEAFQQVKTAETKPPPLRPKKMLSTSISAFSLSSVSKRQVPEERIRPSVSVMERARSLEQLSQAQELSVPWHRDSGWGNLAESDERDRIIVEGDVTLVHRRRSLRPTHSSESLFGHKVDEKQEEGVGEDEEDEDESSVLHRQNPFFKLRPSLALRPDVARDIRDAREREKELRKLRRGLYGSWKGRRHSRVSGTTTTSQADLGSMEEDYQSRGKLDLVWPPPSPDEKVPQTGDTQEQKPLIPPSQKALLWQRWETGTVNGHVKGED
ncbi:uncharacterized protein LOC116220796 isoform X2 [Clupea harengus]|uniref:Uncharacterized protein LOC116220796 isoform X2 n=1 Tax=Clupea harengus TaxID=7950 RepID=A0A6P8FGX9_CLUHA|nr:uncharacterized protein LOC116220796 isoform X2 [Clupea harengus]